MLDYDKLGARIRELRLFEKMTQERLAEHVNVTSKHISNIENGASKVSVETLINIANSLNTTMDFLLQDSILCEEGLDNEIASLLNGCSKSKKGRLIEYLRSAIKIDLGT